MKAAIYARVSTSNDGQDPTMQTRELREYVDVAPVAQKRNAQSLTA
jgi:DNA invertase Pin-like site-specific DNA recombinase